MSWLLQLDGNILLWIQEYVRNGFLTPIMKGITSLGNLGWFWIVLTIILCIPKKTRWIGFAGAMALIICALFTNVLIKPLVARIRPYEVVNGLQRIIERQKDFSFPSGHSSFSFAGAVAYYIAQKRELVDEVSRKWGKVLGICAIVLATLIAFSRLYVGVHYPTDVICGILVGCFAAWAANRIMVLIQQKQKMKK